jgi:serine/threonine protein kinase
VNILINDDSQACLADFGLTRISATSFQSPTPSTIHTNARWCSLELVKGDIKLPQAPDDVYAFGFVCLEVRLQFHVDATLMLTSSCSQAYTLEIPFPKLRDVAVISKLIGGSLTISRPSSHECKGKVIPDQLWVLMQSCWEVDRKSRPTTSDVRSALRHMRSV